MDSNKAMGDKNALINPGESDASEIKLDILGGAYLLVASRIIIDQDSTRRTVGIISCVVVEKGQERICRRYLSKDLAQ